jgi:hypothetical protein
LAPGEPAGLAAGEPVGDVEGAAEGETAGDAAGVEDAGGFGCSDEHAPRKLIPAKTKDANIIVLFIILFLKQFSTS